MSLEEAQPYHTEPLVDGVRFVLSRRKGQGGGICLILFGMLFSGFAVFWSLGAMGVLDDVLSEDSRRPLPQSSPVNPPVTDPDPEGPEPAAKPEPIEAETPTQPQPRAPGQTVDADEGFDVCRIVFGLFGLPFFLAGLLPITFGLMSIFGHSEIEITNEHIHPIDRLGPIRLGKRRHIDQVTGFKIGPASTPGSGQRKGRPMFAHQAIHVLLGEMATITAASGYPLTTLRQLAQDLAYEVQRITGKDRMPVTEEKPEPAPADDASQHAGPAVLETPPPQPADSKIIFERVFSGLTVRVPPTGFRKGALQLTGFGCFWTGFVAIFTLVMIGTGAPLFAFLFISIFWAVGIALLLTGLNFARKQAVIDVVHGTLLITRQSLFGRSQHEWRKEELADIRVDHSGMSVNNKPVMNLQIVPREGKTLGLFTGRDETELHWLAAELRVALQMPYRP